MALAVLRRRAEDRPREEGVGQQVVEPPTARDGAVGTLVREEEQSVLTRADQDEADGENGEAAGGGPSVNRRQDDTPADQRRCRDRPGRDLAEGAQLVRADEPTRIARRARVHRRRVEYAGPK